MTLISARDSAHDFIVKFSPSLCVAVVAYLTGEMAAQSFAYHAHGTTEGDKSYWYPWLVCHDKTLSQPCSLRLTPSPPPPMINHLTSYKEGWVCFQVLI